VNRWPEGLLGSKNINTLASRRLCDETFRLSPRDRTGAPLTVIAFAQFYGRHFDATAATFLADLQEHPNYPVSLRGLAACYAHLVDRL
jgi:hypothetical protein